MARKTSNAGAPAQSVIRSRLMARVRQRGTSSELVARRLFREQSLRFRTNAKSLPGSPDLLVPSRRLAVFVHGCFWHRHARCRASSTPKTNKAFWSEKFAANMRRDRRNTRALKKLGYSVLVIWECQTKNAAKLDQIREMIKSKFSSSVKDAKKV